MKVGIAVPQNSVRSSQPAIRNDLLVWGRADLRNLCFLLAGFAIVLLLIPPVRAYPMSDDWAYAQSVGRLLDLTYRPHDWTQPTALGHLIWGVPLALLFGYNFTVLTIATLFASAACLGVFYTLLRHLGVASTPALFGTALLGLNPMYVYLTYSFMTDITFILYMLAAFLCFTRWAQGRGDRWLILGSIATALAYLTRQHGIVLVPAMLFFLWWVRRLNWRNTLMLCAIPLVTVVAYMAWERMQPTPLVSTLVSETTQQILGDPVAFGWAQLMRSVLVLALPGLCLLPLVAHFKPSKPIVPALVAIFFIFFQVRSLTLYGTMFPSFGSLVDHKGLVIYDYDALPIWTEQVWVIVAIIGSFTMALYLTSAAGALINWVRAIRNPQSTIRNSSDAAIVVYGTGLLLAAITFASPFLFDRYILPLMPMMLLFPLRKMSASNVAKVSKPEADEPAPARSRTAILVASLLPLALFSLLAMRDYKEHAAVRWQAAEQLAASGIARENIAAGFEWSGWYLFQEGADLIRATGDRTYASAAHMAVLDPIYQLADMPLENYRVINTASYSCWLCGGASRQVYVQELIAR